MLGPLIEGVATVLDVARWVGEVGVGWSRGCAGWGNGSSGC